MGFPIGKFADLALRVSLGIARSIPVVEMITQGKLGATGKEKKQSVMQAVQTLLESAELAAGVDLANDSDVLEAAGAVNDAVVALHKVIARKALAAAGT